MTFHIKDTDKDDQFTKRRFLDLANESYFGNCPVFSDFLTLNEQSLIYQIKEQLPPVNFHFIGGSDFVERKIIAFVPEDFAGIDFDDPVCFLLIEPQARKFAKPLFHRDILGSLMGLGIKRNKLGDILINQEQNHAVLICKEEISDFIIQEFHKVSNTLIKCSRIQTLSDFYQPRYKEISGTVASIRLDSLCALAMKLSRSAVNKLILQGDVFVNGKCISSNGYKLHAGDVISVRHHGKFAYLEEGSATRKGRLFVKLQLYI